MSKIEGYIPKEDRPTVLLLCDDIRAHSGVATMARQIVVNSAHRINWFNVGALMGGSDIGKVFDVSKDINKRLGIEDADVKVRVNKGYGTPELIRALMTQIEPDAIMIFTDPRYWVWFFDMEREVRQKVPVVYYNIWDDLPMPIYNKSYYDSCDTLLAISKQTKNINEMVLGERADNKLIKYVPHGIDENIFYPIQPGTDEYKQLQEAKTTLLGTDEIEFIVFWNSRNIHRKHPADILFAYKMFCDEIGDEAAKKCALVMHTQPRDSNGTDLFAIRDALFNHQVNRLYFSDKKLPDDKMNWLYNFADVTVMASSNEGWGLGLTESMMAGRMIIANVTGGMQDQMRFEDEDGNWIDFDKDFPSNHQGRYKKCGEWAVPVFPTNISVQGSIPTPYIFDDRLSIVDLKDAILEVYNLSPEERIRRGLAGREWACSEEAGFTAKTMSNTVADSIERTIDEFTPRERFNIFKVEREKNIKISHPLTY